MRPHTAQGARGCTQKRFAWSLQTRSRTQRRRGIQAYLLVCAMALSLTPRLSAAQSDTAKDVSDKAHDGVDTAKDKLGTDSGTEKVGRHVNRAVRTTKHNARHAKSDAKQEIQQATKPSP